MVFSSLVFLSLFLPLVWLLHTVLQSSRIREKNAVLLFFSLIFYAYGEPVYVLLLLCSAVLNFAFGRWMGAWQEQDRASGGVLALAVVFNLSLLGLFKYASFAVSTVNALFGSFLKVPEIALPIGISFYTFQALSYLIDVHRKVLPAERRFFRLLLYLSFFPQLIAGPIVKYRDIAEEIDHRKATLEGIFTGICRFSLGLGKKVLIANACGMIADTIYGAPPERIFGPSALLAAFAYMLQIYYDFSGYSDMAIGLGLLFGFHFQENFRSPYRADSVREFWRRWHISLSSWFRDYLYIPLGGNRRGPLRTVLNKYLVFLCTGLWHGANITFLFWGFFHGSFLMLEEILPVFRREKRSRAGRAISHLYLLLVVLTGFVFFRADSMGQGFFFLSRISSPSSWQGILAPEKREALAVLLSVLTPASIEALLLGALFCFPLREFAERNIHGKWMQGPGKVILSGLLALLLAALSILSLAGGSYNPFIYFRF